MSISSRTPSPTTQRGDRLLAAIALRIRQSLNLEEILNTAVEEVRQLLACDRVIVYRFQPDWSGQIVVESVGKNWTAILGTTIRDNCFAEKYVEPYKNGRIRAIDDISIASLSKCHIDLLSHFQVRANLVVPILQNSREPDNSTSIPELSDGHKSKYHKYLKPSKNSSNQLWGLLIAHQCSHTRLWKESEIELVKSLATHLAIAIQQSELYHQLKTELAERQRMEVALKQSEQRFRNLIETSSDWVWEIDDSAVYTYVSPKIRDILGYEPAEAIGKTPFNFMPWSEAARVAQMFAEIAGSQLPFTCLEYTIRHKNGRSLILEASGVPFFDVDGTFRGYRGMARDITERKQSAAALQEAHQRLTFHVENSPLAVVEWDDRFRVRRWSEQAEKIFGWKAREVLGKHPGEWQFIYNADLEAFANVEARLIGSTQPPRNISCHRNLTRTGAVVYCEWYNSALRDESGNLVSILSLVLDVTERQKALNALQKAKGDLEIRVEQRTTQIQQTNEQLLDEIVHRQRAQEALQITQFTVDRAAEAVFWIGSDGRLLYVNEAACRLLGYSREELLSITIADIEPDYLDRSWAKRWKILKQQRSSTFESDYRTKDGRVFPVEIAANYLKFKGKEYKCAFVRDITERKRAEAEVLKALEIEKELSQLKSRIVSVINHEYRTPLTTIFSSAELLEYYSHKWTEDKKRQHFHRIKAAVNHLTQLIDDVLVLNKADARQLKFNPTLVDLVAFCQELTEQLQATAGKNHQLTFAYQGDCGNAIVDEKLLRQLLTNLLTNAIKYSPQGGAIRFDLSCQLSSSDGCWSNVLDDKRITTNNRQLTTKNLAIFRIRDKGLGIPVEDQPRLFKSFHRGSNVGTIAGTGLGLAIVKKCVDLHDGQIDFESQIGVGTTFTVVLPIC